MYGSHTLVRRINCFSYCISFHGTTEEIVGVKKLKTTAVLIVFGIKLRFKCLQKVICDMLKTGRYFHSSKASKLPSYFGKSKWCRFRHPRLPICANRRYTTYTHIKIRTFETEVNEKKSTLLHRLGNHVNACFSYHSFSMFLRDS